MPSMVHSWLFTAGSLDGVNAGGLEHPAGVPKTGYFVAPTVPPPLRDSTFSRALPSAHFKAQVLADVNNAMTVAQARA